MAFSEILKIKPQLDNSDLRKMENTLNARFRRIAKKFGGALTSVFKAGGGIGLALGLVNKFLNPLKETQESIERLLTSSDDIATNAAQFETTTGKLYKLISLAKSSGLSQDNLFMLLSKYQNAIGRARLDPNDISAPAVQNYVGDKDIVDSFFSFIQDLRKMDTQDQVVIQEVVFGQKQILKMADFLQTDFPKRIKDLGIDKIQSEEFTKSIEKMAALNDYSDILAVRRENNDLLKKSQIITREMIDAQDRSAQIELERDRQRIKSYDDLRSISDTSAQIFNLVEKGVQMLGSLITTLTPAVNNIVTALQKLSESKFLRGIFGGK